jgi:hypothetical protein
MSKIIPCLLVTVAVASGCTSSVTSDTQVDEIEPEAQPEVVQTDVGTGILNSSNNKVNINLTVLNKGDAAEAFVEIEFFDSDGDLLSTSRKSFYMGDAGYTRKIDLDVAPPDSAESYNISARGVDFSIY